MFSARWPSIIEADEKVQDLGVAFTSDGRRQDEELEVPLGKASAVMQASHH